MNNQERNGTKGLIILLFAMVLFALYQVVLAPKFKQEEVKGPEPKPKDEVTLEELGGDLYNKLTLTINEEFGITVADQDALYGKLSIYKMTDALKINIGIKNVKEESIVNDGGYSLKEAANNMDGNFYYSGKYITTKAVEKSLNSICGPVPIKHQTITLRDNKYVYDKNKNIYEIWILRKTPQYTEQKVTYNEVVVKGEEIFVYEYVAYTDYKNLDKLKTRTVHSKNIEVAITEDNVTNYLSYMDKYKYTFKKDEDGNYYFVSIEYVYE